MKLRDSLLAVLGSIRPEFDFSDSDDFLEENLLDSLDIVMFVAELEKRFAITICGTDITPENFRNISSLESLVCKYIERK